MGIQFPDDVFVGGVLRAVQQVSGAFFTFGGPGSEFSLFGGVSGIFLGSLDPTVSPGFQAGRGSIYLKGTTPQGVYQKTGTPPTAWTLVGGSSGGGSDPSTTATSLVDFFTLDGASDYSSGSGTSQIVTGTTIGGSPMLGVEQLTVEANADEAGVVLTPPVGDGDRIIDDQTVGKLTVNWRLYTSDPQTDPINQSTVRFSPSQSSLLPMFIAARITTGNNNWHCISGDGTFDTGVPVDTTKPHQFTITIDPTAPLTTWQIDGVTVHTAPVADAGPLAPCVDITGDNGIPDNTVLVDWIQWTMTVDRNP